VDRLLPWLPPAANDRDTLKQSLNTRIDADQITRRLLAALEWILEQPRTVLEKLGAIEKLLDLPPGPRIVRMSQLTGWHASASAPELGA
jgi:hypothetical protein